MRQLTRVHVAALLLLVMVLGTTGLLLKYRVSASGSREVGRRVASPNAPEAGLSSASKPPSLSREENAARPDSTTLANPQDVKVPTAVEGVLELRRGGVLQRDGESERYYASSRFFGSFFGDGEVEVSIPGSYPGRRNPFITYAFEELRIGDRVVARGGSATPQPDYLHQKVTYAHGALEEEYELRNNGVEQTFIVRELPGGPGEIVVLGKLGTNLKAPPSGTSSKALAFEEDGKALLRISDAVAVDANGNRRDLDLAIADGRLRLVVPEEWVRKAQLPIRIDPLVGSTITVDLGGYISSYGERANSTYNPDANEWLVVWREYISSQRKHDPFALRISASGVPVGSALNMAPNNNEDSTLNVSYAPSPAAKYLMTWKRQVSTDFPYYGRVYNSDLSTSGSEFVIKSTQVLSGGPVFGGTRWLFPYTLNGDAFGLFIETSGALVSPEVAIEQDPIVSSSYAIAVFLQERYLIAWRRDSSLVVQAMDLNGSLVSPYTAVFAGNTLAGFAGGADTCMLHWSETTGTYPNYIVSVYGRLLDSNASFVSSALQLNSTPSATSTFENSVAAYSSMASQWLTAYRHPQIPSDIGGRRVTSTGTLQSLERLTTNSTVTQDWAGSMTWNSTTNEFLCVYQAIPPGGNDQLLAFRYTTDVVAVPGNFRGTASSASAIQWAWDDVSGETGYAVHDVAHVVVPRRRDCRSATGKPLTLITASNTKRVRTSSGFLWLRIARHRWEAVPSKSA